MKSWKTTSSGGVMGLGAALMGVKLVPGLDQLPASWLNATMLAGFILSVAGPVILGLVARDNGVTSEQAGAVKPEQPTSKTNENV